VMVGAREAPRAVAGLAGRFAPPAFRPAGGPSVTGA
jgi:hypothetical protein